MKLKSHINILGEAGAFCAFGMIVLTYIQLSINGLQTGYYTVMIDSNSIGEHWFEIIAISIMFAFYVYSLKGKINDIVDKEV